MPPLRRHAEHQAGLGKSLVECAHRGAMLRRGGEMQGIAGAKPECVLIDESRRHPEMPAVTDSTVKLSETSLLNIAERRGALLQVDLPCPQLDRHGGGHLGDSPVADQKLCRILLCQPALKRAASRFVGERRDDQRRVEIEHQ